ncbi:fungal-specific transcription factor domain-containing protein [Rhizoctonia solani]|nr:fungal-specific transcription factor domain-containing protein [Rhizoctonia solani]
MFRRQGEGKSYLYTTIYLLDPWQVQCRFKSAQYDKCKGCTALGIECNWTQASKPQLLPDVAYIRYLETKIREIETYLKQTYPRIRTKKDIEDLLEHETGHVQPRAEASVTSGPDPLVPPSSLASSVIDLAESPTLSRFVRHSRLAEFGPLATNNDDNSIWEATPANPHGHRYFGHSSTCVLSRDAVVLRHDCGNNSHIPIGLSSGTYPRSEFWKPTAAETMRPQPQPHNLWETEQMMRELPSDDLLPILLSSYFDNTFLPVIHRQLFEKKLGEGLHKQDESFLRLVLLVCANGARWCNDPRVLDERWPVSRSAGHRWFRQFELWQGNVITTHQLSLWDAQALVLIAMFFCGSSATYGAWVTIGAAIRMMQDIGSHRRKAQRTLESELHKRCFWAMLSFDRLHSVHFGRNGAIADSDIDLDEVLEVDDELWLLEPGASPPSQPIGALSKLRCFNQVVELTRISGRCLQTVYALNQTKRLLGIGDPQGLSWIINDINTRLLNWAHSMPVDLQLPDQPSPNRGLLPSAFINMWASYYESIISINRPFISKTSELAASCLAICREAAKAFSKMARVHCRFPESRSKFIPGLCYPAFSSAMVLAIDLIMEDHVKGSTIRNTGCSIDMLGDTYSRQQKEEDMRSCVQVLEDGEEYFQLAGKLRDVVREFEGSLRIHSPPPPQASPSVSEYVHSESTTSRNEPILQAQNSSHDAILSATDTVPPPLGEPNCIFDIFTGYEFANPYFLASGIASGFPRGDQISNLGETPFASGIPDPTDFSFLER